MALPEGWENSDSWHTMTGVCTDSTVKLYLDGKLAAETDLGGSTINDDGYPVHIGHNAQLNSYAQVGIDTIQVYNRAFTDDDVANPPTKPTSDTLLWYQFDKIHAPVISGQTPTDPDGDGLYEDINGDGEANHVDVVDLFENSESEAVKTGSQLYDFNGNGRVDYDDIVELSKSM